MPLVTDTVKDPQGRALVGAVVTIRLFASENGGDPGYVGASDYSIQDVAELRTNGAGLWSATLVANDLISPANSYYEYTYTWRGRVIAKETFTVPNGAGPYWVGDSLHEPSTITPPGAVTPAQLAAHEADTTVIHGITDTGQIALKNVANTFTQTQTLAGLKLGPASIVATASLPAAGSGQDGTVLIEDNGTGDQNLIIYAGSLRFRLDGAVPF